MLIASTVSFAVLTFVMWDELKELTPKFGWPNYITAFRYILLLIGGLGYTFFNDLLMFIILGVAVLLDGLDGIVARKTNSSTTFGKYFDMEIDAIFVMLMSLIFFLTGVLPWWILIAGFLRYVFGVVFYFLPEAKEHKKEKIASIIAGTCFVLLLAILVVPVTWVFWVGLAVVGLLCFSFARGLWQYIFAMVKPG